MTERYRLAKAAGRKSSPWNDRRIRDALIEESRKRCIYCDSELLHVTSANVEHYRPRSAYPELVVEWSNLAIACSKCNQMKSDKFSEDLPYVFPFADDPDQHFLFVGDLIFGTLSDRGAHTVLDLGLNREDLISARRKSLDYVMLLVRSWKHAPEVMRLSILDAIHERLYQGEHFSSVLAALKVADVPLPGTVDEARTSA